MKLYVLAPGTALKRRSISAHPKVWPYLFIPTGVAQ